MMRAAAHDNGCVGGLGGGVTACGVKNRVRGRLLAPLERVRRACRGGDLLSGLSHAGGLLIAVFVHLGAAESRQVTVDEGVVGVDDVQGAGAAPEQVRGPDERSPGGLGVVEADDQGGGLRGAGAGRRGAVARIRPTTPASAQAARVHMYDVVSWPPK